jgi:hypothetical protein
MLVRASLFAAYLFIAAHSSSIEFPMYTANDHAGGDLGLLGHVSWDGIQDPAVVLRRQCNELFYQQETNCRNIIEYFTQQHASKFGAHVPLIEYEGSLILEPASSLSVNVLGRLQIKLDTHAVSQNELCTILELEYGVTTVHDDVAAHCEELNLSGIECRALSLSLENHLKVLYYQPDGVTVANILRGTHLQLDLDFAYFSVTLQEPRTEELVRYFVRTDTQYAVLNVCKFCIDHALDRKGCKAFVDYADRQLQAYFGQLYSGQLWALQYVINSLEIIASERHKVTASARNEKLITADFVEIGTSNFDTVTQHVSDRDGFIGFAIEPSWHYLSGLPTRKGVKKVNAAIATAHSGTLSAPHNRTVDLYYIPEEVIDRLGLFYYLKGCNSIGDYHPAHIEMNVKQHVVVSQVPALTIEEFLRSENIRRIGLLKIDAEGYDVTIMEELYQQLVARSEPRLHVDRIMFESNDDEQRERIRTLIRSFVALGYRVIMTGENTILENLKTS